MPESAQPPTPPPLLRVLAEAEAEPVPSGCEVSDPAMGRSQSTWVRDHGHKRRLYESLHVAEYFLFDPPTAGRPAQVTGLTLSGVWYEELPQETLPNGHRGVRSNELGLAVHVRDDRLRWYDPASGKDLYDYEELYRLRDEAVAREQTQAAAAREEAARAKAGVAELEALLKDRGDVAKPR